MVEMNVTYDGSLACTVTHEPSGVALKTVPPVDNMGDGSSFSPTDLVGAALASCVVTTIAIVAQRNNIDVGRMTARVEKEMSTVAPRRISRLPLVVRIPVDLPEEQRVRLEHAGHSCPVHKSLHPDVDAPITFVWGQE